MSIKKWTWLVLGAATAILLATCAPPIDKPTAKEDDPAANAPIEVLPIPPTPVADGPRSRIEAAVENIRSRDLLTTNGFWTVFHGILGLGPGVMLRDPMTGTKVNAVDYICDGGDMRGLRFLPTRWGLDVQMGPMMVGQGHQDQFVAEMGEWGMKPDRKFVVFGKDYTFMDFVRQSQMRARVTEQQELSWAIVVIGEYLGTDIKWTNAVGEKLHYEDMIRYELDANVEQAACGGTHRLFGLCYAYYLHMQHGGKKTGVWQEVVDKMAKYRDIARKFQNPDGSFSTEFFRGPGNSDDKTLRINTTGHTLEWLALALSDKDIRQPWVQDAANALALMILDLQESPIEGGSLYHATHGLLLYYARVYDRTTLGPKELHFPPPPP